MNIAIREPWSLLNGFLGVAPSTNVSFIPAVDVQEEQDRYVVKADLPGVTPADVEVTADRGVLTMRGERKEEKREQATGYERLERVTGSFVRRFTLPDNVQADAIKARFTNGVLEISIPKQPEVTPRRVAIEAA